MPSILAIIPASLAVLLMEVIVHFPGFVWLDRVEPSFLVRQLPILFVGIVIYIVSIFAAFKVSVRRFERVDL